MIFQVNTLLFELVIDVLPEFYARKYADFGGRLHQKFVLQQL